jgi:hypothetical protein
MARRPEYDAWMAISALFSSLKTQHGEKHEFFSMPGIDAGIERSVMSVLQNLSAEEVLCIRLFCARPHHRSFAMDWMRITTFTPDGESRSHAAVVGDKAEMRKRLTEAQTTQRGIISEHVIETNATARNALSGLSRLTAKVVCAVLEEQDWDVKFAKAFVGD